MKNERRNDKLHQRLRLQAYRDADATLHNLHRLVAGPGRCGLSVGEMVNVAATMGLLRSSRGTLIKYRKLQEGRIS